MRFEEFVLRVPGDEFRVRFDERLTVLAGVGAVERDALVGSLVGALTGDSDGTALTCVDHTGRVFELVSAGGRVQGRYVDDGSSAPVPIGWFAPDAATLRKLMVLGPDDVGLRRGEPRREFDVPELVEARITLDTVTAQFQRAVDRQKLVAAYREELAEVEDQIQAAEGDAARRQYAAALADLERVRAEVAAARSGTRGADADRHLLLAAEEASRLATRAAEAAEACIAARAALDALPGGRAELSPGDIAHLSSVPDMPPADLGSLLADHQAAVDRATALDDRLRASAAANLPAPSDPRVPMLASLDQDELWGAHDAVVDALDMVRHERLALGGIGGPGGDPTAATDHGGLAVERLEEAHHRRETADAVLDERRVTVIGSAALAAVAAIPVSASMPVVALLLLVASVAVAAVGVGRPLVQRASAARAEAAALAEIDAPTYLSFHMRRVDALLDPDRLDRLAFAEADAALAERSWQALGSGVDVATAAALRDDVRQYATALGAQHGLVEELAQLHHELDTVALPALGVATDRLLLAVGPYGLDEDDLTSGPELVSRLVHGNVALGGRARAQARLDEAEADREKAESRLDDLLSQLGFADGPLGARAQAFDWAVRQATARDAARVEARAPEVVEEDLARLEAEVRRLRRPEWSTVTAEEAVAPDATAAVERRAYLLQALAEQRDEGDVGQLSDRRAALERRVAALEAQRTGGMVDVDVAEVQQYLLAQLARAANAGPGNEPIPVVLDDPFAPAPAERKWELMDMIARLAERAQIVYLTDDAFVGAWARRRTATGTITLLEPVE